MGVDDVTEVEPTAAERVRSTLAAAGSLTVTAGGRRRTLNGVRTVPSGGRLLLRSPAGDGPADAAAEAFGGHEAVTLEFTDVAPAAVRARVRARVTITGRPVVTKPEPEGTGTLLCLEPSRIVLDTPSSRVRVGREEFAGARADPLAFREADLLTHLADRHGDVVAVLTRLLDPWVLSGVTRVMPLAVDRHGLVLRLEYARAHRDVRLPFGTPLREAAQVKGQMRELITAARSCRCRHRPLTRP